MSLISNKEMNIHINTIDGRFNRMERGMSIKGNS